MSPASPGIDLCKVVEIDQDSGLITIDDSSYGTPPATYTLEIKGSIIGFPEQSANLQFNLQFAAADEEIFCPETISEAGLDFYASQLLSLPVKLSTR